jgi:hypothetical protein
VAGCCARAATRIGVIIGTVEGDPQAQLNLQVLQKGLRERGLNDGHNLQLDVRVGANNAETAVHESAAGTRHAQLAWRCP